ncbi:MAG: efflux RND transporter periplasmic adaptor subunit [Nitrospirae bacterium]|nr:efflux RND transporter periplasmic adaptor subunit [Nitrospirota bacterium]
MIKYIFTSYAALMALFFFIPTGCAKKDEAKQAGHTLNVQVEKAAKIILKPFIETTGTLLPFERVTVSSELDGILSKVAADEGSRVKKGALLAEIDNRDYALELNRSERALEKALATLKNAETDFARKEPLYKEQLITKQQFDDVSTTLVTAKADAEGTRAALGLMRQRLSKTAIFSPLTGAVELKKVSLGDFVRTGTPMFVIIQTEPLKLRFSVSERDAGKLRQGLEVTFTVDGISNGQLKGLVSVVYPNLDEKTRSLQAEAIVNNADGTLRPGLFAKLKLFTGAARDITAIPATSILYAAGKVKVFVKDGDTAREKYIETGQSFKDATRELIEVATGLTAGEEVVTVGQQGLVNGARIKAVEMAVSK